MMRKVEDQSLSLKLQEISMIAAALSGIAAVVLLITIPLIYTEIADLEQFLLLEYTEYLEFSEKMWNELLTHERQMHRDFWTEVNRQKREAVGRGNRKVNSADGNQQVKNTGLCPSGEPGPPGLPGYPGEDAPDGIPGADGQVFVWIDEFCAACPPGPPGLAGYKGLRGQRGPFGAQGSPGLPGLDGERGADGPPGSPGLDGEPGVAGEPGRTGSGGFIYIRGEPGRAGENGPPGLMGDPGPPGRSGEPGSRGIPGAPGKQGEPGLPGLSGPEGESGRIGSKGMEAGYCPCPKSGNRTFSVGNSVQQSTPATLNVGGLALQLSGTSELDRNFSANSNTDSDAVADQSESIKSVSGDEFKRTKVDDGVNKPVVLQTKIATDSQTEALLAVDHPKSSLSLEQGVNTAFSDLKFELASSGPHDESKAAVMSTKDKDGEGGSNPLNEKFDPDPDVVVDGNAMKLKSIRPEESQIYVETNGESRNFKSDESTDRTDSASQSSLFQSPMLKLSGSDDGELSVLNETELDHLFVPKLGTQANHGDSGSTVSNTGSIPSDAQLFDRTAVLLAHVTENDTTNSSNDTQNKKAIHMKVTRGEHGITGDSSAEIRYDVSADGDRDNADQMDTPDPFLLDDHKLCQVSELIKHEDKVSTEGDEPIGTIDKQEFARALRRKIH